MTRDEWLAVVWESLPQRFPSIEMDAFVVMPNHIHGIIIVEAQDNSVGMPLAGAQGPGAAGIPTPGATTRVAPTGRSRHPGKRDRGRISL